MFVEVIAHGNIGIEAGLKGVGKITDINAFFVSVILDEGVCFNTLLIFDLGLGLHFGALASTFFF